MDTALFEKDAFGYAHSFQMHSSSHRFAPSLIDHYVYDEQWRF